MSHKIVHDDKSIEYLGKKYELKRKEFHLFEYLYDNRGKVVSRQDIMRDVWGTNVIVTERTVDVHIRRIRESIPDAPIVTRRGFGYIWKEYQDEKETQQGRKIQEAAGSMPQEAS